MISGSSLDYIRAGLSIRFSRLGSCNPMIARVIVERFCAATIIRCRFATLVSPRIHVRLAPPVSQT